MGVPRACRGSPPPPRWALRAPGVWGSPRGLRLPRPAGAPGHPLRAGTPPFPALALRPASPAWVWGERDPSAGFGPSGGGDTQQGPQTGRGTHCPPSGGSVLVFPPAALAAMTKRPFTAARRCWKGQSLFFPSLPGVPSLSQPSPSHPNTFSACASLLYEKTPKFLSSPALGSRPGWNSGMLRRDRCPKARLRVQPLPVFPWQASLGCPGGGTKRLGIFAG